MVLTIKMGTKPQEGARRRKPTITRKIVRSDDSDVGSPSTSQAAVRNSVRKPNITCRIVSSESDSSESIPDTFINQPSTSRTPIDKPKNEKTRIGPTPNGDSKKKNFVRPNGNIPSGSTGFGSKRAINALTGVNNGFVYQLKNGEESNEGESDSSKDMKDFKKCNGSLVNSSLNEEIPEGTVIVQPEAAPDGEEDWYKSKEFGKRFHRERRERRDVSNQNASSTVESVFCTACGVQVNPFDKKTFFCHPVLSVVICKGCMEFYDSGPWKKDEDGIEEECRWCGEGGSLSCCDFCCKTFCKRCIMRNLGRAEWNRTLSKQKWKCYVCEPSPLRELVAKCAALLSGPVKTEKKEKEKSKVNVQKKVIKAPKKEKKSLKMQDAAIAEEFLQYLVGNISNRALFMKSLVRLKKEVPDMQKLQMNLSLKHIGEVMSVLGELESCVKRQLYGDVHKSDSALDGTDPEDFDSPERKSKAQMERTEVKTDLKDKPAEETKVTKEKCAMHTTEADEGEEADVSQEESSIDEVGGFENEVDAMDIDDTELNHSSRKENELVENDKVSENGRTPDVEMGATDNEANVDKETSSDVTKGKELKEKEQVVANAKLEIKLNNISIKQEKDISDEVDIGAREDTGNSESEDMECSSSQHSARKMKVTPRSPRSRRESQDASIRGSQASKSQEDEEARLMSMIDASGDDSSEGSEGSDYTPNKSSSSSKKSHKRSLKKSPKKSPAKAKRELSKEFPKPAKENPVSSADSDCDEKVRRREGPGEDSSNPEEVSGFEGIPGESSTEASQDEGDKKEKIEKSKDNSSAASKQSRQSSESSENESFKSKSESISERDDDDDTKHRRSKRMQRKSGNRLSRKKNKPEPDEDSVSEEEMELKRLEGIGSLKRKRNRGTDSDDAPESIHDAQDMPGEEGEEEGKEGNVEEKDEGKMDVEEEKSESEEIPFKKEKKVRKSPAKIDPKSREILSSDSSSDDQSDAESDGTSGLRWKSLNQKGKKKENSQDVAERLLMEELDGDDEEEDDDDDSDEDEEMDGAGSKRSKRKAQKKAEEEEPEEEDEDWEKGESRQNGTGGGAGGSGGGKKGGDGKDKKRKDQEDDDDDEEENEENLEENGEEEDEEDDSDHEVGTKKSHPLLRVQISESSNEDEEDEDTAAKKKGKKGKAAPRKRGKATRKKKRKEVDTDDYFTSSESEDLSDERPKRKRVTRSQTASSTEDSSIEQKKPKKRARRKEHNTSSEADSSKETKPKKRGGAAKGKKRRRIKVASDSDTEDESKTQDETPEEKEEKGSGGSSGDENTPRKGRKQIRRVLKKSKLQAETLAAELEEQERRKRIEQKRKEIITEEEEQAEKSAVVKTCVLEKAKDSDEVLLEVDERIVENLKPHQAEGIQFMFDSTFETIAKAEEKGGGCILAHCMGLGKTLQVIAYLHTIMTTDHLDVKTCLVVAPLNTVLNWEDEFEKWIGHLDSGINVYELSSVKNNSSRADYLNHWHSKGGVMIMGYAMYRNLSLLTHIRKKKEKAIFLKTLVEPGPDIVVCDEGHMLKNESSAISKAMNNITTLRRICLTGTPLQNNLIEYHCMVHFVKPNLLGTMREFKNRFVNPITNGQHSDSTARDVKIMKRRAHVLHNLLSGCVQRKDYTALTKFLPPKHEFVISVRLSEVQIKLYEHYLNTQSGRKDDGTKTQATSLFADYQSLMNVWTHPRLLQLATQREDRNAAKREMEDFVTSEEEEDDDDSLKAFVISSDSDLEDPWKSSSKKKSDRSRSSSNSPRPRPSRRGRDRDDSDSDEDLSGEANNDGNNSDSSVEVVKTWNTRSRAKEAGLSEGASTSAADFDIPPEPEKAIKWYSDFFSEDDAFKIELSGKLVLLFEILKMAESVGEKVLVFSQSLLSLDMIEDMLAHLDEKAQEERANGEQDLDNQIGGTGSWIKGEDYFRMDGSTAAHLRRRWSEIFNDLDNLRARLFLISTRAGSLGTNLIAANRVIIFDANWNPSHDIQSIFRVYRFGQERAVFIYRLIAQGTMEEKIYDRQVIKQSLSQRVVDEHQIERHFTSADLSELYNFTPDRLDDPNRPERPTPVLPKDFFLAELLKTQMQWIVKYHEHDSLLENQMEEELTEEERQEAWKDYDAEKNRQFNMPVYRHDPQDMERIYKEGESILRMGEMVLNHPGQSTTPVIVNSFGHPGLPMGGPSMGVQQTSSQMQRLLEMQSLYRAQMQQQHRQRWQQEQQQQRLQQMQQLQRLMMRQAGEVPNSSNSSASMQQLQQIALMQQQQQRQQQQQQRLLQQQQLLKQSQQKASSSEGKAP